MPASMLTAKQIANYSDVIFRWLATKTARCRTNAERCRILSEARWVCASAIDFEYYAKCLHDQVVLGDAAVDTLIIHQSEDHEAMFEFKGPVHSTRFAVRTRAELAVRFSELLFPQMDAEEILSLARTPLQTPDRLAERQRLVEEAVEWVVHRDKTYQTWGASIVVHEKRVEKKVVLRNRGPWPLRLTVELLNDDTYECTHDANRLRFGCTESQLRETIATVLSNGFAEMIRQNHRSSFQLSTELDRFLARRAS